MSEESFDYDAAGNITTAPNSSFTYDTNNKLTVFNGQTVDYDCDGNMTFGNGMECGYDSQNRLVYAGDHDYTYNAENVRIRNLCTDEDTTYVYDTNCKLSRLLVKTTNNVVTKYVYGIGLIGEETNNTFKTYHFDSRGSTIAISDSSGTVTDRFAYDTYGKRTVISGTSEAIFGYNGMYGVVTDKNGLIYMRARYYSPEMRRFINSDIVPGKISEAVTLNRYAYANANPAMNIDPLGLKCFACGSEGPNIACGVCSKPKSHPSTNDFGDEENGQVVNKDEYYGVTNGNNSNSKNQNKQTQKKERDYESEAIAKKNNDDGINAPDGDLSGNNDSEYEQFLLIKNQQSTYDMVDNTLSGFGYAWDIVSPFLEKAIINSNKNVQNINQEAYANKIAKNFKYAGYGVTGATTFIYTTMGITQNIQNGESAKEIWSDAAIDVGGGVWSVFVASKVGATAGTAIGSWIGKVAGTAISPGLGTAIGAGIGTAIGWGIGWVYDEIISQVADNMI